MGIVVLFAPFVISKEEAGVDRIPTLDRNTRKFVTDRVQYAKFSRPLIKDHIENITEDVRKKQKTRSHNKISSETCI